MDHGYISLGKYSSARDDILHYLCTSDWANDSFGDVNDYGVYMWKISNDAEDVSTENTEFNSLLEDWFKTNQTVVDGPELRQELVGHFIVSTNDRGFVTVLSYDSAEVRDGVYSHAEEDYGQWCEDEDEDTLGPSRIQEENDYKFGPDRL